MSSTSSWALCRLLGAACRRPLRALSVRSEWNASSGAPAATQVRSRYQRPVSWSAWSSASVVARRSARRARSLNSVSRRLCSFLGRYWSSSLSACLDLLLGGLAALLGAVEDGLPGARGAGRAVQRRARQVLGGRSERGAVAEREREGLVGVAEREPRGGLGGLGRDALRLQSLRELAGAGRVEAHGLAAAGDRRQDLGELVRDQDQDDVGGRLLERLQQRVGRLVVHRVRALEHEDPVLGLERRVRGGGDDGLVDVAPEHLVGAATG